MTENQKLREALQDFEKAGTGFDTCPTRRLPQSEDARRVDEWWLRYFMEADLAVRVRARQAIATTEPEPFDEREAFEKWLGIKPCGAAHDFGWSAWQARAAMAQVSDINVAESFTNDTKDAERYRWLADCNNYYEAINLISDGSLTEDALGKAIDAAMANGVKG